MSLKSRARNFLQGRLKRQRMRLGETIEDLMEVEEALPEDVLTIDSQGDLPHIRGLR